MNLCKKCLLAEIDESDFFQSILNYISKIPPEEKVSDEIYHHRLAACKACDNLLNGMCKKCGCYVELRAAKLFMNCPSENKQW